MLLAPAFGFASHCTGCFHYIWIGRESSPVVWIGCCPLFSRRHGSWMLPLYEMPAMSVCCFCLSGIAFRWEKGTADLMQQKRIRQQSIFCRKLYIHVTRNHKHIKIGQIESRKLTNWESGSYVILKVKTWRWEGASPLQVINFSFTLVWGKMLLSCSRHKSLKVVLQNWCNGYYFIPGSITNLEKIKIVNSVTRVQYHCIINNIFANQ